MSLVVLTGPVRSGKSRMAEELAASLGRPVTVAVAGWSGDGEMERRIKAHKDARPLGWSTIEASLDPSWIGLIPKGEVLLLDCLGTLVSLACLDAIGDQEVAPASAESEIAARVARLVDALLSRRGDTIVVTNETGWGIVPVWPSARSFRDELGRANRSLVEASDAAFLVVDGRCIDLHALPARPAWPHKS